MNDGTSNTSSNEDGGALTMGRIPKKKKSNPPPDADAHAQSPSPPPPVPAEQPVEAAAPLAPPESPPAKKEEDNPPAPCPPKRTPSPEKQRHRGSGLIVLRKGDLVKMSNE